MAVHEDSDLAQELIDRIVDGEESSEEWRDFGDLADADSARWKALARAQRDHPATSSERGISLHLRAELPL